MKRIILTAIFATIFFVGCQNSSDDSQNSKTSEFKNGDKVTLKSVIGNEITLVRTENGFKLDGSDKIIMIDIFGTYCQPCRDEAPHLMSFQLKHSDDFMMIGLIYYEDITNQEIIDNFTKNYNAYYFISNSKENERIIEQILKDIKYPHALTIPFKVVYKDGKFQNLSNNENPIADKRNYYVGKLNVGLLERDFLRIKDGN